MGTREEKLRDLVETLIEIHPIRKFAADWPQKIINYLMLQFF